MRIDGMTFGWVDHFGNKKDILTKRGDKGWPDEFMGIWELAL